MMVKQVSNSLVTCTDLKQRLDALTYTSCHKVEMLHGEMHHLNMIIDHVYIQQISLFLE